MESPWSCHPRLIFHLHLISYDPKHVLNNVLQELQCSILVFSSTTRRAELRSLVKIPTSIVASRSTTSWRRTTASGSKSSTSSSSSSSRSKGQKGGEVSWQSWKLIFSGNPPPPISTRAFHQKLTHIWELLEIFWNLNSRKLGQISVIKNRKYINNLIFPTPVPWLFFWNYVLFCLFKLKFSIYL